MTSAPVLHLDLETRSVVDLPKVGAHRYAEDPSTEIMLGSGRHNANDVKSVRNVPGLLYGAQAHVERGGIIRCHNASFEHAMLAANGVVVPWSQMDCTMARASACGLPGALFLAAKACGTPDGKDLDGYRLMMKLCRPKPGGGWYEDPADIDRLARYCDQDVRVECALDEVLPMLSARERRIWELTQVINDRGVQLDQPMIQAAAQVAEYVMRAADEEMNRLTRGVVQKVTQARKIVAWIKQQGVPCESIAEGHQEELILGAQVLDMPDVVRVVELRAATAKAFKFKAMIEASCADGRVRGSVGYHGTIQGRWIGRGVQFHNMKRVETEEDAADVALAVDLLRSGKPASEIADSMAVLFPSPLETLSICTRSAIIAKPGHRLIGGDYKNIEGRICAWLAGQKDKVQAFRDFDAGTGPDLYKVTAAKMLEITPEEVTKAQRQEQGKVPELACLGPDTLVFTHRGLIGIKDVQPSDRLWDGKEWVDHGGLVCRGPKTTLWLNGVEMTPDHPVAVGSTWCAAQTVVSDPSMIQFASASALASLQSPGLRSGLPVGLGACWLAVLAADLSTASTLLISGMVNRLDAVFVRHAKPETPRNYSMDTQTSFQTMSIGIDYLAEYLPVLTDVPILTIADTPITAGVELKSMKTGAAISDLFLRTSSLWKAGTTRAWKWIEKTLTETTNPEISDLLLVKRTLETAEKCKSYSDGSTNWNDVYDIAHAGPRNRFMVWGKTGPLIVHNCGYQGSVGAFRKMGAKYGVRLPEEKIRLIVGGWRDVNWCIVDMWKLLQDAAIEAVSAKGCVVPVLGGKIQYVADKKFLYCRLPSSRYIHYPFPQVGWKTKVVEIDGDKIEFNRNTVSFQSAKGYREDLYGGSQTAHVVSGLARDVLAEGMFNLEAAGYPINLDIHDEAFSEVPIGFGSIEEYEAELLRPISWMGDCPIAVSAWEGPRYAH